MGALRIQDEKALGAPSTCASDIVPYPASIVIKPPGVPAVIAASGPNSGG